jgi:predicted polyphosphate/ATP-dependent NAD kinase
MKKIGLIINPVAGMGGKVGLKGTDGIGILEKAIELGAKPEAAEKAVIALKALLPIQDSIELITCPGAMGEEAALQAGFKPRLIDLSVINSSRQVDSSAGPDMGADLELPSGLGLDDYSPSRVDQTDFSSPLRGKGRGGGEDKSILSTLPAHTEVAAKALAAEPVELLLFAGGDGTARNIYHALGAEIYQAVIGIPAGVKIHSAVYATTPRNAGELARQYLQEDSLPLRQAEVMDIDEEAFRKGRLSAQLYGYLLVPCSGELMQHLKIGRMETEASVLEAIAEQVVENMQDEVVYIIGPGSTISPIMDKLGLPNTLLGVDVVQGARLIASDVGENQLLKLTRGKEVKIIITVIGGQGYILGRGNQQISAAVIKQVGKENIMVVATKEKIMALDQGYLLVDSGDEEVNVMLRGYIRVITGYREELICKVK